MSTYLSHPVRRLREEPADGERVELVVEQGDLSADTLKKSVEELSGTVERELQFDCYLVDVPEPAVNELCELDGLVRIETAATLSVPAREADADVSGEPPDPDTE